MNKSLNILCGLDESYAQHCAVMLCSLFRSMPGASLRVFLLTEDLSDLSVTHIQRVCNKYGQKLVPLYAECDEMSQAPVMAHISKAMYLRLLVANLLPPDIDRVLYLDSDIIIRSDIRPFYEMDMGDAYVAAVAEAPVDGRNDRLGLPEGVMYFNSGVLLMNLALWREDSVGERTLQYAIENADIIEWGDQDSLNAITQGRVKICPPKWNAGEWVYSGLTADELGVQPADLEEAKSDPAIIHYNGGHKPWGVGGADRPFGRDYYVYLKKTPYFGRKHLLKKLRSRCLKVLRKFGLGAS